MISEKKNKLNIEIRKCEEGCYLSPTASQNIFLQGVCYQGLTDSEGAGGQQHFCAFGLNVSCSF